MVRKRNEIFLASYGDDKMSGKGMVNFMAGLLFVGIFCSSSGAFGSLPHDDAGLSSEKAAGHVQVSSEVIFIDPSVKKAEIIVSQLPEWVEVVRLSPIMDGVAQISAYLTGKVNLSAIHIISHGNRGYFVLNGKRIDGDFLWNHGDLISAWGQALIENGDILLYACNLAATDEGKTFVKRFVDLTGADVAASTDVTGGETFNGNWNFEYSIGRITATALTIDPDVSVELNSTTWNGNGENSLWININNWSNGIPVAGDSVIIDDTSNPYPDMNVSTAFAFFTINTGATVNIVSGGSIITNTFVAEDGDITINGTINAADDVNINISASRRIYLNNNITSGTGSVTLNSGSEGIKLDGDPTITSTSGTVTFMDILDEESEGDTSLSVNAGTGLIDFQQAIGSETAPGTLTITQSGGTTFQGNVTTSASVVLTAGTVSTGTKNITTGTIAVNGGTFGQADSPTGDWDVDNVTIASGATMNATTGDFNVSGDWANSGTFNHKDGTVTLDGTNGADQTISGSTTFYKLTKNVTSAATLTFPSGTTTTVENTLNLSGTSEQLLSLISSTSGTQWEIDPQGTRTIAYLAVKDSNNVGATNINAVGQNCTDSGNNTKWSFTQLTSGTYYVNIVSGNDSNNGSSANPWKTFHYSIDRINNAAAGTYILIMAAGTYSKENGESDSDDTAILSQSNVTIVGADDHTIGANNTTTTIDGTSSTDWTKAIKITGSNVIIRGVSITNFTASGGSGIEISGGTENEVGNCKIFVNYEGIVVTSSSAFKIRECEIYENTTDGLSVTTSTDGEIHHNTIYRHQGAADNGIFVVNCSPSIKRNKIYDNDAGIRVKAYSGSSSVASPDISNNVIYKTEEYTMNYGILVRGLDGTASPTITHNSIDGGSGDGIALERTSGTIQPVIKYNIVTCCEGVGIDATDDANVTCQPDYNDVWGNEIQYSSKCTFAGTHDISEDPQNDGAGPLPEGSPCVDAIPTDLTPVDPVTMDYLGYKRPKGSGFDMGAYEYIATQTYTYTLPGGTGVETDYRIFAIPLDLGTGENMRDTLETTLGTYNPFTWRMFSRTASSDIEMNTQAFASLDTKPGMGFWVITVLTNSVNFTGTLSPDAIYYKTKLEPGWHLFAVPWPGTSIQLGKIYVTDGVNQYEITNTSNSLTQQYIWDYTGTGSNGYTVRNTSDFALAAGTGYYIKVPGSANVILSIPPNNTSNPPGNNAASTALAMGYGFPEAVSLTDDPEPPPLPGGSYGPMPDIRANDKSGPVTVSSGTPVSITVSLDPGDQVDKNADWWIVAHTPYAAPFDWYSYVYPEGWQPGIYPCLQTPLFQVPPSFEVLDMILSTGDYIFYFAVDGNMDGKPDSTWQDTVEVKVE